MRAVRRFSPEPVSDEVLTDILQAARWTGSAKNTQPWHLIVVRVRQTLRALSECGQFAYHLADAPLGIALVMHARGNAFDAGRLAQSIMLAAWAHGVGSCIASLFPDENEGRAKELLGVPRERWMGQSISLGYPADAAALKVSLTPLRTSGLPLGRAGLADLVSWEQYGRQR
jgi:nitroreductase